MGVSDECRTETLEAIVRASGDPLSIVMVGIGDGPWDEMRHFDDRVSKSKFDNFQFICFSRFQELLELGSDEKRQRLVEAAFTLCALQEVPAQYKAMRQLGMLSSGSVRGSNSAPGAESARPRSRSPRR